MTYRQSGATFGLLVRTNSRTTWRLVTEDTVVGGRKSQRRSNDPDYADLTRMILDKAAVGFVIVNLLEIP